MPKFIDVAIIDFWKLSWYIIKSGYSTEGKNGTSDVIKII